jgi:dipeptidyl-peptidase-4
MRWAFWLALSASAWGQVRPHWSEDERQFWYRRGRQFFTVELRDPHPQPAFDHARLAKQLPGLSILGLVYDPAHPRRLGLIGERDYLLDLDTYRLQPAELTREALVPLAQPGAYATTTSPTTVLFQNRTAGTVELSWLDERSLAHKHRQLAAGEQVEQQTYEGQTWLARDLDSGGLLAVFQASDCPTRAEIDSPVPRSTLESPDRRWLVEARDHNLWLHDRPLTRDGAAGDEYLPENVYWAPDSSRFLAMRTRGTTGGIPHPGDPLPSQTLKLIEPEGASVTLSDRLFPHQLALHSFRWSDSCLQFVYQERGHQHLRLLESDPAGKVRVLAEDSSPTFVCDSEKFFWAPLKNKQFIWMSERTGSNHLFLMDGENTRDLTPGSGVVQQVLGVDEERAEVYFSLADPYYFKVCKASLERPGLTVITPGEGQHSALPSPNHRYWVDTWSRADQPPRVELRTAAGDLLCELYRESPGRTVSPLFVSKGRDGVTDIYGRLYFPRNFRADRKYPVLDHIYAGPHQSFAPRAWAHGRESEQQLADLGYIVVQIDGMGSNGRSKAFHDVCWKNLKDAGLPDHKLWIQAAARRYRQLDLDRVGIYGSSAGGANAVAALLWHSDFYKVAAADCGNHDLTRDHFAWVEQWMGWPVGPEYAENSNTRHAAALKGALLLLVGSKDDRVDPSNSLDLAAALKGKDCKLVVLPEGGHCVIDTPAGQREFRGWLRSRLPPAEPPVDRPGSPPGRRPSKRSGSRASGPV